MERRGFIKSIFGALALTQLPNGVSSKTFTEDINPVELLGSITSGDAIQYGDLCVEAGHSTLPEIGVDAIETQLKSIQCGIATLLDTDSDGLLFVDPVVSNGKVSVVGNYRAKGKFAYLFFGKK